MEVIMKNIVQTTLLALALLVPATGFAMEPAAPVAASTDAEIPTCPVCMENIVPLDATNPLVSLTHEGSAVAHISHRRCAIPWFTTHNSCLNCNALLTPAERTGLGLAAVAPAAALVFNDGNTPLHNACQNNNLAEASLLLDGGANIDAPNIFGITPLMLACEDGFFEIAQLLLNRGANVNALNNHNHTAIEYAYFFGHRALADFLLIHGSAAPTTQEKLRAIKLRILQHKGKIAAGAACALAAAGLAYYIQAE